LILRLKNFYIRIFKKEVTQKRLLISLFYWILQQTEYCETVNKHKVASVYKILCISQNVFFKIMPK